MSRVRLARETLPYVMFYGSEGGGVGHINMATEETGTATQAYHQVEIVATTGYYWRKRTRQTQHQETSSMVDL